MKKVIPMMQQKEEYKRVRDLVQPKRCGKYRYLSRENRIRKSEKWVNQNRADARLSSYNHNFARFPSLKAKTKIEQHEERARLRKLAYFEKRARMTLERAGIYLFTSANIGTTQEEENEINAMMRRLSHSFSVENSQTQARAASVRPERKTG